MTRALLTGLLLSAWMAPVHANDETTRTRTARRQPRRTASSSCGPTTPTRASSTDLHKRFRDHTCRLLKQHGAELIGFWTPLDEKDGKGGKLVYLVAFPSREAAKKTWEEFRKDPEWQKVYEESHKNGVLVKKVDSVFLEPTDYSEMK